MNITVGSVVYIDTDEGESIDLRKVDSVKIYPETLDSWLVACRLIYQFELALEI